MQYMLLIFASEAGMAAASAKDVTEMTGAYTAYNEALSKAGAYVNGERLHPSTAATTVRAPGGKAQVLNGPYAESKEQLAGYYTIEAPDLDAALAWAARCPGAMHGAIEVRPVWPFPGR